MQAHAVKYHRISFIIFGGATGDLPIMRSVDVLRANRMTEETRNYPT
jgi:hypothetical protein